MVNFSYSGIIQLKIKYFVCMYILYISIYLIVLMAKDDPDFSMVIFLSVTLLGHFQVRSNKIFQRFSERDRNLNFVVRTGNDVLFNNYQKCSTILS